MSEEPGMELSKRKRSRIYIAALLTASIAALGAVATAAQAQESFPSEELIGGAAASQSDALPDIENEVVVVLKEDAAFQNVRPEISSLNGEAVDSTEPTGDIVVIRFDEANGDAEYIREKVEKLSQNPEVQSAEPNGYVEMHFKPNDTYFSKPKGIANQGNLNLIAMPAAWDRSRGDGSGIGIVDTGIVNAVGGEMPPAKILAQKDTLNGDSVANDTHGHGTSVALLAAARTNNKFGIAGAGFNARVAMCKFSTQTPDGLGGSIGDFVKCLDWLQKLKSVDVLNLSLSLKDGGTSPAISNEIKQTQERYKKLVVASVGNEGKYTRVSVPASLPGVIGVGSNDSKARRSSFSNYGPMVDIMAPGNGMVVAGRGEKPIRLTGTSYSAPQVAGCAALLSSEGYSATQIRSRLLKTATNMGATGRDDQTGYGYLNCGRAIRP